MVIQFVWSYTSTTYNNLLLQSVSGEVVCKTWTGLTGLGSGLGWALDWAGLDFGLGLNGNGSMQAERQIKVNTQPSLT